MWNSDVVTVICNVIKYICIWTVETVVIDIHIFFFYELKSARKFLAVPATLAPVERLSLVKLENLVCQVLPKAAGCQTSNIC